MNAVGEILSSRLIMIFVTVFVTGLLTALLTSIGFWLKTLYRKMEKQEDAHNKLEKNLPVDYVRREDFVHWTIKIDKKLNDFDNKLDKKMDDMSRLIQKCLIKEVEEE